MVSCCSFALNCFEGCFESDLGVMKYVLGRVGIWLEGTGEDLEVVARGRRGCDVLSGCIMECNADIVHV